MSTSPLRANGIQFGPYNNTISATAMGAVGDHSTDNSTALQNCINQAKATNAAGSRGGVISLPPGIYNYSTPLDLHDTTGIVFHGDASYAIGSSTNTPTTVLNYTGTGSASAINAKTSFGTRFENVALTYSSGSFTGYLVDFSHSALNQDAAFNVITDCYVGAYNEGNLSSCAALVNLANAVSCTFHKVHFMGAAIGIQFRSINADYSNAHSVIDCTFQDFATAAITNAGQNCSIQHCTFENNPIIGTPTMAPAYLNGASINSTAALDISFNWIGDGDDSAFSIDTGALGVQGLTMLGNYINGKIKLNQIKGGIIAGGAFNGNGTTSPNITFAGTTTGLLIFGNSIANQMTLTSLPATGVSVFGNTSWNSPYNIADQFIAGVGATAAGSATLGGASTDNINFTGSVATDINFSNAGARTITIGTPAADTAGKNLTVKAGASGAVVASPGTTPGTLFLQANNGPAGTAGLAAGAGGGIEFDTGGGGPNNGGGGASPGGFVFNMGAATNGTNANIFWKLAGSSFLTMTTTPTIFPTVAGNGSIGVNGNPFGATFAKRLVVTPQTVAAATTTTIDPTLGGTVRLTLGTNITTLTINAENGGGRLVLEIIQDATGGRTLPASWTNVRFAGGAYTVTSTLNKRDVLTFIYDVTDSLWLETSRSQNL